MVEYYALMNENGKMRPAETVPGMEGGREDKGESRRGELKYDVVTILVDCKNFCKCHHVPPPTQYYNKRKHYFVMAHSVRGLSSRSAGFIALGLRPARGSWRQEQVVEEAAHCMEPGSRADDREVRGTRYKTHLQKFQSPSTSGVRALWPNHLSMAGSSSWGPGLQTWGGGTSFLGVHFPSKP
jgi:hypothetical protein